MRSWSLNQNSSRRETVGRPMEILLIEDSLTAARLAMGTLKNGGIEHRLTWHRTGEDGLAFLKREGPYAQAPRPDLVLLDLRLPGIDGEEVLADLRGNEATRDMAVVVMTASCDEDEEVRIRELEVQAYLRKPVELSKFLSVVEELKHFWRADMILPEGVSS